METSRNNERRTQYFYGSGGIFAGASDSNAPLICETSTSIFKSDLKIALSCLDFFSTLSNNVGFRFT